MLGWLPVIVFFFFLLISKKIFFIDHDLRAHLLRASIAWGVSLALGTELLSVLDGLTFLGICGYWDVVLALVLIVFVVIPRPTLEKSPTERRRFTTVEKFFLAGILIIIGCAGFSAYFSAPNNYDSQVYHLSRVAHWIQNANLQNYPTHIIRQLIFPPWAEYAILHFLILNGHDGWANLVQWFAMLGSMVGVSLIAKRLGATTPQQWCAAVLATTLPSGILQGSSTQNDWVAAFWLVCFIYFLLDDMQRPSASGIFFLAGSLGLALLTKPTGYIFAAPFGVWFLFQKFKVEKGKGLGRLFWVTAIVFILNAGFYFRNIELAGVPLLEAADTSNTQMSVSLFVSNLSRNLASHLITIFVPWNLWVDSVVNGIHAFLRLNPADERITFATSQFTIMPKEGPFNEDVAGNFIHLVFLMIGSIVFLFSLKKQKADHFLGYTLCCWMGLILFCYLIKWNPWVVRLHLPFFVLSSVFIVLSIGHLNTASSQKLLNIICCICLIGALPWLLFNQKRELLGARPFYQFPRLTQYFLGTPGFTSSYVNAVLNIRERRCRDIGLIVSSNTWEYPVWKLMEYKNSDGFRIEHVNVENLSHQYEKGTFEPCALIVSSDQLAPEIQVGASAFILSEEYRFLGIFFRK